MLEALVAKKLLPFLWVVANIISSLLKRIWHGIFFLLIWKAFRNTKECRFSFWNIFPRFRDIDTPQPCKLDQWWRHKVIRFCNKNDFIIFTIKMIKYSINNISKTIEAVFLALCTTNMHHKRNKMTPWKLLPWRQFCRWCCLNKNWNSQCLS